MSDPNNLYNSADNQDIMNNIQNLQTMETDLFNSLESTPNLSQDQKISILNKINQLSQIRISLYNTLNNMNDFYENALSTSNNTLTEQTAAIEIIENALNKTKQQMDSLTDEKNNKIRLIEINRYYGERYSEHSKLMKIIIFMLIPIIILAFLNKKNILPNSIFLLLIVIVIIIGSIFLIRIVFSIMTRNNMEYDTYDWVFNINSGPSVKNNIGISGDPWTIPKIPCISTATTTEATGATTTGAGATTGATTTGATGATTGATGKGTESFSNMNKRETMANNIFTKYAKQKNKKPHVTLGGEYIQSYNSP